MSCLLCKSADNQGVMILMPPNSQWPSHTFHAFCIQQAGGELEEQGRALWARLNETETWDAMIERQSKPGGVASDW